MILRQKTFPLRNAIVFPPCYLKVIAFDRNVIGLEDPFTLLFFRAKKKKTALFMIKDLGQDYIKKGMFLCCVRIPLDVNKKHAKIVCVRKKRTIM